MRSNPSVALLQKQFTPIMATAEAISSTLTLLVQIMVVLAQDYLQLILNALLCLLSLPSEEVPLTISNSSHSLISTHHLVLITSNSQLSLLRTISCREFHQPPTNSLKKPSRNSVIRTGIITWHNFCRKLMAFTRSISNNSSSIQEIRV